MASANGEVPAHLDFTVHNDSATETIILIHGMGASGLDWDLVQPYLNDYHLLVPSLFTSQSLRLVRNTKAPSPSPDQRPHSPQWQSRYVYLLANLIRDNAIMGRAHIVGLSLGGCFAIALAATYPELMITLFVSGLPKLSSGVTSLSLATCAMWMIQRSIDMLRPSTVERFLNGEVKIHGGGRDGNGGKDTYETMSILVDSVAGGHQIIGMNLDVLSKDTAGDVVHSGRQRLVVRVVAATRRIRWIPIGDSPEWALEATNRFLGNETFDTAGQSHHQRSADYIDAKVYEAKGMFHAWNRQNPELFARCILATVHGQDFPGDEMLQL